MPRAPRFSETPLQATPSLERLLVGLGQKLRLLVLLRALGLAALTFVVWWAWAYFADFVLAVPSPVRRAHGVLLIVLPLVVFWRTGLRHLFRLPGRRELAILLEARQGSQDLFTSATDFQLSLDTPMEASQPLIARLFASAEARAEQLAKGGQRLGVLDARRPLQSAGAALFGLVLLVSAFGLWPHHQRVFASRIFGAGEPWPQLTFLTVEVPLESGVRRTPEGLFVRMARGEDLPVTVLAEGRAPETVELLFDDGSKRTLAPAGTRAGGALFVTTLRGVSKDLSFLAVGGDDRRGLARVTVEALSPPDLRQLVAKVTPPDYSGLATQSYTNSDLAVLAGSRVEFLAEVTPANATGFVRLLPEDRLVALEPSADGLAFALSAERSLRLRFELTDDQGLANPDPGLWSLTVREDRAPRVSVRSPETLNLETTDAGVLPLWVAVDDDFAVTEARLVTEPTLAETKGRSLPLELRPVGDQNDKVFAFASIPLGELTENPEAGRTIWVEVEAKDNRVPVAGTGRSPKISLRILAREDYMRRIQDRLAGTRRRVSDLYDLQREKLQRTQELADAVSVDGSLDSAGRADLATVASGARRIEADSMGILRELAALTGDVLHARVDAEAKGQLEQLDRLFASSPSAEFDPGIWSSLVNMHNAGKLGKAGFAGHLLELTGAGLSLAQVDSMLAREALELALDLSSQPNELVAALDEALDLERANLASIEALLGRLAEWDNFQSVLSLAREVLERQRALQERTKDLASQ